MKTSRCTDANPACRRIAFLAGSFDPFTIGHENIALRALSLFDELVIGIGVNPGKPGFMPREARQRWIEACMAAHDRVRVVAFDGLAADAARAAGACCFVRGVRSVQDYDCEMQMSQANRELSGLDTVVLFCAPEFAHVSSSLVRELHSHGRDVRRYLPDAAPLDMLP